MCALLLKAIEQSGSGPPPGVLSLMEFGVDYGAEYISISDVIEGGVAFFRAVLNHLSEAEEFAKSLVQVSTIPYNDIILHKITSSYVRLRHLT